MLFVVLKYKTKNLFAVDQSVVKTLDLCRRLVEVVKILLPIHVEYALLKDRICALLTALYSTLNCIVKLVCFKKWERESGNFFSLTILFFLHFFFFE